MQLNQYGYKLRLASALAVMTGLAVPCSLNAENEDTTQTQPDEALHADSAVTKKLQTVKVTATCVESDEVIDSDELELDQAWDISDVFALTPQIDVGGGGPNAKRLYLRGIAESLVSVTIDGAKQSKDLHQHRGGLAGIEAELLKGVEVDAGVTAADAGPGNVGGAIRFTTKDAQDMLREGRSVGAFAKSSYASASEGWKNSLAAYTQSDHIGVLAYVSDADADNYRAGNGETMLGTAEESRDYFAKVSILDILHQDLRLSAEQLTEEGLYKWGSTGSDMGPLTDETLANRQKSKRQTFTLNHKIHPESEFVDTDLTVYANNATLENLDAGSEYESDGVGGTLKNTAIFRFFGAENKVTFGADYTSEEGRSTAGEVTSENLGWFLQNRMRYKALSLSLGARYDDYETDFAGKKISGDATSPNVNAEVAVGGGFSLYAGYGEAVSGANTIPVGWLTNLADELKFNGDVNGTLDAETSKKAECGVKFARTGVFAEADRAGATVSVFRTRILDSVVVGTGGARGAPVSDIVNDDELVSKGVEFSANWGVGDFDAAFTYAHNDLEENGEAFVGTVKRSAASTGDRIVFNPRYKLNEQFDFGYTLSVVLRNDDGTTGNDNNGGYVLHGIQARYHPSFLPNATVSLAVSNLFDRDYSSQTSLASSGVTVLEPGRDVRLSVSYNF